MNDFKYRDDFKYVKKNADTCSVLMSKSKIINILLNFNISREPRRLWTAISQMHNTCMYKTITCRSSVHPLIFSARYRRRWLSKTCTFSIFNHAAALFFFRLKRILLKRNIREETSYLQREENSSIGTINFSKLEKKEFLQTATSRTVLLIA